jgi:hypothetical protein
VPVSMMLPPKVRRSTMAAQRQGSEGLGPAVEGLVGCDRDAGLFFPFGEELEQQLGTAAVEFHVAELVDAEQVDAAVAGDGLGQLLVVGGLDELVDELGRQGVADAVAGRARSSHSAMSSSVRKPR